MPLAIILLNLQRAVAIAETVAALLVAGAAVLVGVGLILDQLRSLRGGDSK
jgi:hypothetical protein